MSSHQKTANDLEWSLLLDRLAERCTSALGQQRVQQLQPADDMADAQTRFERVRDAMALADRGDPIPVAGVMDVGDLLLRLSRDADGTAAELHSLRQLLRQAQTLRRFAGTHREARPALAAALTSDTALDRLLATLDFSIDTDGGLADRASTELAQSRRRAADMRQRVVQRLEELIHKYAEVLQDRYYTVRDGRYVLPVRSDSHIRVPGIVLGSSASGHTLFIEPGAVMSLGNQLKVAIADVEREEARVLADLSGRARRECARIEEAIEACITADVLLAITRFAEATQAIAVAVEDTPVLELRRMRHPILMLNGVKVVPNDLTISCGKVLVISGPNAGGKTVALKCMGLAAWMVRAGLPLPVDEGSRVGWFEPVLSDVGDDQSLSRSLSTFSAHVTNLAQILSASGSRALVLLDELAGGTDPEEGSVLAAAVLERLSSVGAATAVTTHYEMLKTLALRDERLVNASVGFDLATMLPSFAVTMGVPGASSALAVAQRFGIPVTVIERARALLPEHSLSREDALRRIQDEHIGAQLARRAAEDDREQIAVLRRELETQRNAQRAREQEKISREARDLLEQLRRARESLREVEQRSRKKKLTDAEIQETSRMVDKVAQQVALGGSLAHVVARRTSDDQNPRRPARVDELRPGQKVFVARLGTTLEVLEAPAKGQVRVGRGPMKLYMDVSELLIEEVVAAVPERAKDTTLRRVQSTQEPTQPTVAREMRVESNTADVRGLRADDAISLVDSFIDRVYGDGERVGFVLHGHGTGALKIAVRAHLERSPHVARSRAADPDDGGDAFTVFWVK
ncbi:MAG: Smr/MutS family protein [Deltaproteobacteria bacterium]|nr:Smr/MutS family protein [Deltaproteobacteria bacterium]